MRNFITFLMMVVLSGCASSTLKAPCDYAGHFCGKKIPINTINGEIQ